MKAIRNWFNSLSARFQKTGKQFKENIMDDLEITDFDHRPIFGFSDQHQ